MSKVDNQIRALQMASQTKRQGTIDKVRATIERMQDENIPINICAVANLAGISRSWLYKNDDFKRKIRSLRKDSSTIQRVVDLRSLIETRDKKIAILKEKNRNQKDIIKKLRRQLEFVYGELYKANQD